MKMNNHLDDYLPAYGENFEYAFDNNIILNWYPKRIMELSGPQANMLELGIGHGFTSNLFSQFFHNYTVIDGSPSVITQFRQQYPLANADIIQCYFEDFESTVKYNVIVMGFILEHVEDPIRILQHFKQFLVPGGKCFIAVPNAESLHRRFANKAGLLPDIFALGNGDIALGHKRLYTVSTLTDDLISNNYHIIRKEGIFLKPLMTSQLVSLNLDPVIIEGMCKVGIEYPELSAALLFEVELT